MKLVTIATEMALEPKVIEIVKQCGAASYTVTECVLDGDKGARIGDWDQNKNSSICAVCTDDVARKIVDLVQSEYASDYVVTMYLTDAELVV